MKKMYVNKNELNSEELKTGKVSYKRIVERFANDMVLCNNIVNIDETIWDNVANGYEEMDIYQYFLCNLGEYGKEKLIEYDVIVSYSDMLECDVIMVDHWGTSWDYVMTDVKWTENIEERLGI